LEDLAGGRLVTVGGAADRFAEDGLRLLRLARFAAALDLAPTAAVLEGARKAAANLDNVSRERIAQELERLLLGPAPVTGLRLLAELDLFSHCLPTWNALDAELRWQALDELELDVAPADEVAGERLALGIAILLEADPAAARGACSTGQEELLASLRPSRLLTRQVHELWTGRRKLEEFSERAEERTAGRAKRLRLFRGAEWTPTVRLTRAWRRAQERPERILAALAAEARAISQDELWPAPLLTAEDLKAAGLQPGPRFGELLEELEDAQLDGELDNRAQAEEWLALRTGEQSGPDAG
jgi:tRNA nucleotidyltransferase/poly(A) polymerase